MANKRFCDRCGKEIKPTEEVRYAGISIYRYEGRLPYELCPSCSKRLTKWLNSKVGGSDAAD